MFLAAKSRFDAASPKQRRSFRFFVMYVVWLTLGTMFYAYAPQSDFGIIKGFYMAINVGYSIGFGYPSEEYNGYGSYLLFSSVYVIIGASFGVEALTYFAETITEDDGDWFTRLTEKEEYEEAFQKKNNLKSKSIVVYKRYSSVIHLVFIWLAIVLFMMTYSRIAVPGWSIYDAQYFAISTCSTGGLYGIPADSPDWLFAVTAIAMAVGVPIMGVAMAYIARFLKDSGDLDITKAMICAEVDIKELEMLARFGLEDGDGQIDQGEFIILSLVRMGTDPNLIEFICHRFAELDEDDSGTLSIEEITNGKCEFVNGTIRSVFPDESYGTKEYSFIQNDYTDNFGEDNEQLDDTWCSSPTPDTTTSGSGSTNASIPSYRSQNDSTFRSHERDPYNNSPPYAFHQHHRSFSRTFSPSYAEPATSIYQQDVSGVRSPSTDKYQADPLIKSVLGEEKERSCELFLDEYSDDSSSVFLKSDVRIEKIETEGIDKSQPEYHDNNSSTKKKSQKKTVDMDGIETFKLEDDDVRSIVSQKDDAIIQIRKTAKLPSPPPSPSDKLHSNIMCPYHHQQQVEQHQQQLHRLEQQLQQQLQEQERKWQLKLQKAKEATIATGMITTQSLLE